MPSRPDRQPTAAGRAVRVAALAAGFVWGAGPAAFANPTPAGADDPPAGVTRAPGAFEDHGRSSLRPAETSGFDPEQLRQIRRLEDLLMCACPKENWSKTLLGCPDHCADRQKLELRELVREGRGDAEVLAAFRQRYGSRVLAAPEWRGAGKWTYILPLLVLMVGVGVAACVLRGWFAQTRPLSTSEPRALAGAAEIARVERELERSND